MSVVIKTKIYFILATLEYIFYAGNTKVLSIFYTLSTPQT